jgi:hypothetical protein
MKIKMKMNKKTIGWTGKQPEGFTIVEALVNLMLMLFALLMISTALISAIDGYKKSFLRFTMTGELESCKNRLLSKPFDARELEDGNYAEEDRLCRMKWNITTLSPSLKIIRLSITYHYKYGPVTQKTCFYKSKFIETLK